MKLLDMVDKDTRKSAEDFMYKLKNKYFKRRSPDRIRSGKNLPEYPLSKALKSFKALIDYKKFEQSIRETYNGK